MAELVKAWAVFRIAESTGPLVRLETLYCERNGRLYRTDERPFNDAFAVAGDVWTPCAELPSRAEFIGNYHAPANLPSA